MCANCEKATQPFWAVGSTCDYIAAKEGAEPVVNDCSDCAMSGTYVQNGEVNTSFACAFSLVEACRFCGNGITPGEYAMLDNGLCGYCSHRADKIMRE